MPGISAIVRKPYGAPIAAAFCAKIRDGMLHFPYYESHLVIARDSINVGYTRYPQYPVQVFDHDDYVLVLEGKIYNQDKPGLEATMRQLAVMQLSADAGCAAELTRYLLTAEGEFVITMYDKVHSRIVVANDIMGRLPLYYYQDAALFAFARELKFIIPFLPQLEFDANGVAAYLLYGFPFAGQTLVKEVCFFPAATCISMDLQTGKTDTECYHVLNLESGGHAPKRAEIAAEMHRLFMDAVSNRVSDINAHKTIVSLSGGFDSRATLAGLKKKGLRPTAVTSQSAEEPGARAVARALDTDVYAIAQGPQKNEQSFAETVFLKDGLDCHPNLGQLYQNLQNLRTRFGGDIVYFTGIYGGEITRHSHPTNGFPTLESLTHYLLTANDSYKYSAKKVAAIMQMAPQLIEQQLKDYLTSFPETSMKRKYIRFRHEYDVRFAGEAEDRNRFYFWTISPYFAFPFFSYVMTVDEHCKTSWLFRDFLLKLDPDTCKAPYFNYHLPLDNTLIIAMLALAERLTRHVMVKNMLRLGARLIKTAVRVVKRPLLSETALDTLRIELIGLLKTSVPVRTFFTNPALPSLIIHEKDIKGLQRLHIVFVYMNRLSGWRTEFSR